MAKRKPPKHTKAGKRIIAALTDLRDTLRANGGKVDGRYVVHQVTRIPEPSEYDARQVKMLREKVGATQDSFARVVGVSKQLVAFWEQGRRTPAPVARRLLDVIKGDPQPWQEMLRKAI